MTGYRDEDSTFKGFDLECIEEGSTWAVYVYKEGVHVHTAKAPKKKQSLSIAKDWITEHSLKYQWKIELWKP